LGAILLFNGLLLAVLAFVWDWRIKTEIDRRWQEFQKATTNYHKGLEYDHAMYGFQCNREYDAVVRTYRQMQRELGDFSALSPYVVQTVSEKLVNAFAKGITFNQLDRDEVAKLALILRDGSCGQIHYSVGICLLATKQFDDARRSFERAYAVPNSGDACGNANGAAFYFVITELADLNHKTADDKVNAAWARLGELVRKKSTSSLEVKQTLDALREDALIEHVIGFDPANTRPACDKLRDRLAKKILVLESGKVIEVDTPRIPPPPAAP
jgi:tetratricopeptide (TPR) repeat protein